jgi:hypothetical protein
MAIKAAAGYPQYSGSIITPMFSMDLLEQFYCTTVFSDISTTEYVGELTKCGDQITFFKEPEVRVREYIKNQRIEHDTIDSEPLTMVIDRALDFSIKMNQIDEEQICNFAKWRESFLRRASYQLARTIDSAVLNSLFLDVDPANRGSKAGFISKNLDLGSAGAPLTITPANAIDIMSKVHQVLDEQCAPRDGRFMVVPPSFLTALRASDIKSALLTGLGWSPLINGRLPETVMGFTLLESVNLRMDAAGAYHLMAGVKSATAFASQIDKTRVIEDKDDWATYYQGLAVYGFKTIYPKALVDVYAKVAVV